MAPQISQQLRERIVIWRYEEHKKASEIALLAGCAESTIYEILRLYRDFGQVNNRLTVELIRGITAAFVVCNDGSIARKECDGRTSERGCRQIQVPARTLILLQVVRA